MKTRRSAQIAAILEMLEVIAEEQRQIRAMLEKIVPADIGEAKDGRVLVEAQDQTHAIASGCTSLDRRRGAA